MGLYELLGLEKTATKEQIKKAYKNLCKLHHPDKGGSIDEFTKIKEAYDVLMDDNLRDVYDKTGTIGKVTDLNNLFMAFISSQIVSALENFSDDPRFDLIAFLKNELNEAKDKAQKQIIDIGLKRNTLENKSKNVKNVKGEENLLKKIIELTINEYNNHISQIKSKITEVEYLLERLSEYSYDCSSGLISQKSIHSFNTIFGY